jgi:hypothetical protein
MSGIGPPDPIPQVDAFLDKLFDRLDAAMTPVWEGQNEMARTLITLSAGALVLTVSVVQFLADRLPQPEWSWLLPASWICFGASVVTGVVRHGWSSQARSLRARFEFSRGALRDALQQIPPDHAWAPKAEAVIAHALDAANVEPAKAVKVHDGLIIASAWTFILGLACLVAFAVRNLPF